MALTKDRLAKVGPVVALVLFSGALVFVRHELKEVHYHNLVTVLHTFPLQKLILSLICVFISYGALTGYDALGLKYAGCRLGYFKTALTSFISFVFSNNFGFSAITGGLTRFRLYSVFGIGAMDSAKVAGFCVLTFWSGILFLGGLALFWEPLPLLPGFSFALSSRWAGVLLLACYSFYLALSFFWKKPLRFRQWEFQFPKPALIAGQLWVSILDWTAATAALYFLLPAGAQTGFLKFLPVYILAQLLGLFSHIPGGLGVFEAALMFFTPREVSRSELFAALLAYRALYYLVPLIVASLFFSGFELFQRRVRLNQGYFWIRQFSDPIAPILSTSMVFLSGVVLLLSGSMRSLPGRLEWLNRLLPLGVLEASHFLAGFSGLALLLLARGLQLRLDVAYYLTLWLLGAGAVFSLLKGFDFEEALFLIVAFLLILPCRSHFYRRSSIREASLSPGWMATIVSILLGITWLGFFSYQQVEYRHDLWWTFNLHGDASRFLRSMAGMAGFLMLFAGWRLLSPARVKEAELPVGAPDGNIVESIVRNFPRTYAYLSLLGDKSLLFNEKKNAFIMFRGQGHSLIAMGDPIGPEEEIPELVWRFKSYCDQYHANPVFYQVTPAHFPLYIDIGLSFLKLGEESRIPLAAFSVEDKSFKGMHNNFRHLEKAGVVFEIILPPNVADHLVEIKKVSDAWMSFKNAREKGFSLGYFDAGYLRRCPVAVAKKDGKIIAFSNLWLGGGKEEISIDLMRYSPDAPKGIMDYLLTCILLHGKSENFRWFNFGMAPLSGIENRRLAPLWSKAGAFIFQHGEHFYNFQGLRQYKEKFHPVWEPRYLASPGGLSLPRILTNLATLISSGSKGTISK